jgi:hypothetical protein
MEKNQMDIRGFLAPATLNQMDEFFKSCQVRTEMAMAHARYDVSRFIGYGAVRGTHFRVSLYNVQ